MRRFINPIFIIVLIALLGLWGPSRSLWHSSFGFLAMTANRLGSNITGRIVALATLTGLDVENQRLTSENMTLQAEVARLHELEKDNETLRRELDVSQPMQDYDVTVARVIGYGSVNFLQTLIIDKGSSSGIAKGQTVASQGYLVGQIASVSRNTSQVSMASSSRLIFPVVLQESRGTGIVYGGLEGLMVNEISLDIPVKEGELALTRDVNGLVAPGIIAGTVKKVIKNQGDIFQQATLESPINWSNLETIMIFQRKE